MKNLLIVLSLFGAGAWAQQERISMPGKEIEGAMVSENENTEVSEPTEQRAAEAPAPVNRDPAQDSVPGRKTTDEELRVRPTLPDAQVKKDSRSLQSEVYKTIYNRDLKPDQREDVLDE